jgi:hypothetical protein
MPATIATATAANIPSALLVRPVAAPVLVMLTGAGALAEVNDVLTLEATNVGPLPPPVPFVLGAT